MIPSSELEAISRPIICGRKVNPVLDATLDAAKEVACADLYFHSHYSYCLFANRLSKWNCKASLVPLQLRLLWPLFGSFFVSRTVTPLMCLNYLPPEKELDRYRQNFQTVPECISRYTWEHWIILAKMPPLGPCSIGKRCYQHCSLSALSLGLFMFIEQNFSRIRNESRFTVSFKLTCRFSVWRNRFYGATMEKIISSSVPETQV